MCFRIILKKILQLCVSTSDAAANRYYGYLAYDIPIISYGTVVEIQSTRCNGIKECWNDIDEHSCSLSTSFTILVGKC